MLNTMLLPLDGSPLAERALTYATALARRTGASIELIQAVHAHGRLGVDLSDAQLAQAEAAETYLDDVAGRDNPAGIGFGTHVSFDDPVHAILNAAERLHTDLIVMSTHGRGGLSRMLYGSVADQVLRHAGVPVLLVPSIVEHAWPADGSLSLLVPLDGSELAAEALGCVEPLTESFGLRLTLLRVVQPPAYPLYGDGYAYVPYDEEAEVAAARDYLNGQSKLLSERGLDVQTRVVVGEPTRTIGEVARELNVDLVVMATHGTSGLSRLILGSVATGTLRHTTAPLLLVRPPMNAASDGTAHGAAPPSVASASDARAVAAAGVVTAGSEDDPTVTVQLSASDLELIVHSLKALGHAPGYDYGHVVAARSLADRLVIPANAITREVAATP